MTYTANGIVRDYDIALKTATVELTGIGVIDTWLDGVKPDVTINPAFLVNGASCVLTFPDAHRLCEAQLTTVYPPSNVAQYQGTTPVKIQIGRVAIPIGGGGSGAAAVVFPFAFATVPNMRAQADGVYAVILTAITTTGFTISIVGAHPNSGVLANWFAEGT